MARCRALLESIVEKNQSIGRVTENLRRTGAPADAIWQACMAEYLKLMPDLSELIDLALTLPMTDLRKDVISRAITLRGMVLVTLKSFPLKDSPYVV